MKGRNVYGRRRRRLAVADRAQLYKRNRTRKNDTHKKCITLRIKSRKGDENETKYVE